MRNDLDLRAEKRGGQRQTRDPQEPDETPAGCRNQSDNGLLPERLLPFVFEDAANPVLRPYCCRSKAGALLSHIKSVCRLYSHLVDRPVLATSAPGAGGARGAQASGLVFALL